jgi:tetratricopeptide (TPR) repeat protein
MNRLISSLAVALTTQLLSFNVSTCGGEPERLYYEASKLLSEASEAENTSFGGAFKLYEQTLEKLDLIVSSYPTTDPAIDLTKGRLSIGSFTLNEFRDSFFVRAKLRSEAEQDLFKCALAISYHQELFTLSSMLADRGDFVRAKVAANHIRCPVLYFEALGFISVEMLRQGHEKESRNILNAALDTLALADDAQSSSEALIKVANGFFEVNTPDISCDLVNLAKHHAGSVEDTYRSFEISQSLADLYLKLQMSDSALVALETALRAAELLDAESEYMGESVRELIPKYIEAGRKDTASDLLRQCLDIERLRPDLNFNGFQDFASLSFQIGDTALALLLADSLVNLAHTPDPCYNRELFIYKAIPIYLQAGRSERATEIGNDSSFVHLRDFTLREVAVWRLTAGELDDVTGLIDSISDPVFRDFTRESIAWVYTKTGRFAKAERVAEEIVELSSRNDAFSTIALGLFEDDRFDDGLQLFDSMSEICPTQESYRTMALGLTRAGQYERALGMAAEVRSERDRNRIFRELMDTCWIEGDFDCIRQVLEVSDDVCLEMLSLANWAQRYADQGQKDSCTSAVMRVLELAANGDTESCKVAEVLRKIAGVSMLNDDYHLAAEAVNRLLKRMADEIQMWGFWRQHTEFELIMLGDMLDKVKYELNERDKNLLHDIVLASERFMNR